MDTHEAVALGAVAKAADAGLKGLDARSWRDRLEGSLDDLRSAFEVLLDEDRSAALQMATGVVGFWTLTSRIPEGRAWLDRACAAADPDDATLPRALYENALLAFWQGDDDISRSLLARSLDAASSLNDATGEAVALCGMARVALREGDLDRARGLCEQALERVEGSADKLGRSNALHVLGVTAQMRGDLHEAAQFMNRRLQLARELNHLASVASEAGNLSVVERQLGNMERATQLALESLALSEQRGDEWMLPYQLNALAGIAAAKKDFARAATLLGAAAGMMERMGTAWPPDEKPHFETTRSAAEAALAPDSFERAWAEGEHMTLPDMVALAQLPT
ncbi:MAG TPA: tetratricopeptide repeat protein [Candidatus Nitrosopolaris sp.]|nr:tetratricopeptide repeat protein [Candidatus Nitrosopolaris sp.]